MKDLAQIAKNIQLTSVKQNEIVIDEFAKSVINKVFDQLAKIFPAWQYNWKSQDEIDSAKMEWVKAFVENGINTTEQVTQGFKIARASNTAFLPSCGTFVSWCKPTPESMGWPTAEQALKECVKYRANVQLFPNYPARPLIITLCAKVDWWLMSQVKSEKDKTKANDHFSTVYMDLLNSGYQEPQKNNHEQLPTQEAVNSGLSEQQKADKKKRGLEYLAEIKRKFKN